MTRRMDRVCAYASFRPMRLHIALSDDMVDEIDRRAGPRRRSVFIAELVRRGLEDDRHWDDDPAAREVEP